jgi:hypothetical protein
LLRLSAKGNISDLIFWHTLKTIDSTKGYSRLLEECNKYHVIIKTRIQIEENCRQKGKLLSIGDIVTEDVYVRAPVVDHCTARLETFGTRPKNKNIENDVPTIFNNDDKESISVTSPLRTCMNDDARRFTGRRFSKRKHATVKEEGTDVIVQPEST